MFNLPSGLPSPTLMVGEALVLMSWWKAVLVLLPFLGWGWVITRVYDKHAARFHLARESWNLGHLIAGCIALAVVFLMPVPEAWGYFVGLFAMLAILAIDLAAYAIVANRDDRVPEQFRIRLDMREFLEARAKKAEEKKQGKAELVIHRPDKSLLPVPDKESPDFALRLAGEAQYMRAREVRASQVDIRPSGKDGTYVTTYLIDGVRQPGDSLPGPDAIKLIDFWKTAAGLDVADRRRRLTADFKVERDAKRSDVRLTTSGVQGGMMLSMVFDPREAVRVKFAELGFLDSQIDELKTIVADAKGLVLLAAPPDQGRTTTMYAMVKQHDAYTQNVQTVELDIQDAVEGVRQNTFNRDQEGADFATLTRSILRRDPDVVAVAELPDANTAKELSKLEVDRTRVYLCIPAEGALPAIQLWAKAVGDNAAAARVLHGVVAQRLIRKLCVNCRVAYAPSPDMLKKLGLPADKVKQLYKKGGQVLIKNKPEICPVCRGIGYIGQEGVFEVYAVDDAGREAVRGGNLNALRAEFRKRQLPTIQQAALRRAVEGYTSVEEVMRVTAAPEKKAASSESPAPATGAPTA